MRGEMVCYLAGKLYTTAVTLEIRGNTEATTLKQSTAASIFWTLDEMDRIAGQLAYVGMCPCLTLQQPR